jgi:hypothetical protein
MYSCLFFDFARPFYFFFKIKAKRMSLALLEVMNPLLVVPLPNNNKKKTTTSKWLCTLFLGVRSLIFGFILVLRWSSSSID